MNWKWVRSCLYLLSTLAVSLACGLFPLSGTEATAADTPTAVPSATSTPIPNYDGSWSGSTSQGKPISLVVEGNVVTKYEIQLEMQGVGCSSKVESTIVLSAPVVDAGFDDEAVIGDATHAIEGQFTSDAEASGTLQYSGTAGCSGSVEIEWTAAKGAAPAGSDGPKPGRWAGEPAVSFLVAEDGGIRDFHIEIKVPLSDSCIVDVRSVDVQPDGTFRFQFGDSQVEDANLITGKFEGPDAVSGTYSGSLFCVDSATGQGFMSLGDDGAWTAGWVSP
jgi:hypothetical protein